MGQATIDWVAGVPTVQVYGPDELRKILDVPDGRHAFVTHVTMKGPADAGCIITNDVFGNFTRDDYDNTTRFAEYNGQVVFVQDDDRLLGKGYEHVIANADGAAAGFQATTTRFANWHVLKNLVVGRDSADDRWIVTLDYEIVPGGMRWDDFFGLGDHVQINRQTTPGGSLFQVGREPGGLYFKVSAGNVGDN